jgi:eukaryotic-like serine/threonine-protein kinase
MSVSPRSHYCSRCLTSFQGSPEHCPNLSCKREQPEDGWGTIHQEDEIFDRNYRIIRLLAMGGAGITYLARELGPDGEDIETRLAIKVLFSSRNQGSYLRRLATEAQILQEMQHEHTAEYRGFVHRAGHSPYLLTRFEAGGSLLDHIRRVGTLPVRQAAAVGSQICMALEKSHEMGVIHRDLKPENVLIAAEVPPGQVPHCRVADFGIAKVSNALNSNLTRAGAFVGTPHFAAPEQFLGGRVGITSDTYAVGAILHFCMMGRHVMQFADRLPPEDSWQILVDSLPAQVNRPDDPPGDVERMNRVLAVVMDPRAEQRCTATELAVMLSALILGKEPVIPDRVALPLPSPATEGFPSNTWATTHTVHPAPSNTIDPDAIPDTPPSEAPDTLAPPSSEAALKDVAERASTGCVVGGVLAAGLLIVVLAGGWAHQNRPDLLGLTPPVLDADLPALTGHETDEPAQTDYRLLYESLEALGPWLQEGCSIPAGSTASLLLVVEEDGAVRSATVIEGVSDAVDSCLLSSLPAATLNRGQPGPIQFPKVMTWE